jgi:hypothetical protein
MADTRPFSLVGLLAIVLIAATPATAQTPNQIQELDRKVKDIQTTIDQLKKDAERTDQIARLTADIESVKRSLETMKGQEPLPHEAFSLFLWLGGIFAAAWCVVNWRRELTRREEAITERPVRNDIAIAEYAKRIDEAADKRIDLAAKAIKAVLGQNQPPPSK